MELPEIQFKNSTYPFRFYQTNVITEPARAFFPYPNFWRGDYKCSKPIVVHRQAGFRPREFKDQISSTIISAHPYPQHCFANPSTRYPCYPDCIDEIQPYRNDLMSYAKLYLYR
jgi:hypothetical protein